MPRPIHTPAPKLIATPDLRPFSRAEMAEEIRRSLCGYPRVTVFLVENRQEHGQARFLTFTGKELEKILPALPLTELSSAVGFDESGAPAARVSPIFKKAYGLDSQILPVHKQLCIHKGKYTLKRGECGDRPNYWAGINAVWVRSPRWFGFGYAGVESRAISH